MKILLARTAGFCMGVRRAMRLAIEAASQGAAHTCGPLIHNRQAVELLARRGVAEWVEGRDPEPPPDEPAVVRAHGLPPGPLAALAGRRRVVDATCPHVLASQRRIRGAAAEGRLILLAGDPGHPEIEGLAGQAPGRVRLLAGLEDARRAPDGGPALLLAQTTFDRGLFDQMRALLAGRMGDRLEVFDSICDATDRRQREALDLAARAGALVVVGGRHSANTRRLAEAARGAGARVWLVETADELRPGEMAGCGTVAVTAGASTPGWITAAVVERLEGMGRQTAAARARRLLLGMARARLTTALGAAGVALAAFRMAGLGPPPPGLLVVVAGFLFFAHTLNRGQPIRSGRSPEAGDAAGAGWRRAALPLAAWGAGLLALACAAMARRGLFGWVLASGLAAWIYSRPRPPRSRRRRLERLAPPASKDLGVATATALLTGAVLAVARGYSLADLGRLWVDVWLPGGMILVFLLVFCRTVLLDLRDIEGDRLVGAETLPVRVGERGALLLTRGALGATGLLVAAHCWRSGAPWPAAAAMLAAPAYGLAVTVSAVRSRFRGEAVAQWMADGLLIAAGLGALPYPNR